MTIPTNRKRESTMAYLTFLLAIITAIKHVHLSRAFAATIAALALGIGAPASSADDDGDEIPFAEAEIFFELNDTDGDLGIHALIDGDAWKKLVIEDPGERRMLKIRVTGRLRRQGLTELFFESAEPTFDELPPEKFFRRFPEGTYEIEGVTLEGIELESEVKLTHVMPAPAVVEVNGAAAAANCDAELPVVNKGDPVTLTWAEVTMSHPDPEGGGAGVQPPIPVTIHNYEVVVEIDETPFRTSIILSPDARSFGVPSEILALSDLNDGEVKFEILVREASFNQTAVESCFCVGACP